MANNTKPDRRLAGVPSYRAGLVAVIDRCAPGSYAHSLAVAELACWDARYYVRAAKAGA